MGRQKTKQLILFLLFTLIPAAELFSQPEDIIVQQATVKYLDRIKAKGHLIVAMISRDQYPFFYTTDEGSLVGLDVDIAKKLAASIGVQLKIDRSAASFNGLIPLVESRKVDIALSKLSRTLSRSQKVLFSRPYMIFRQGLLVSRIQLAKISSSDNAAREVIRQFSGKLGVIANSSYERYAKANFPQAEIVAFSTWEDTLQALSESKVFAVYRDEMETSKYIQQNPEKNLYFKPIVIQDRKDPLAIAMPNDAYHFLFYVNLFLSSLDFLPEDSEELLNKYNEEKFEE
ncbi:ABC transporter substrate-binding protein [Candidatus Haliotispira prima]|uniref:ABC transporter substrate-binding protein n=1 Tax=Candidatus Haliotispira prima TaxID=3034016 RepID=A0ABY8MLL0_9SPIO|nr:ABC transporter substrate-binding protein [Candidatus Haliotispira prima]